ncbi:MAG: MFS transporter, partial [Dehalococcoidia bacterium]
MQSEKPQSSVPFYWPFKRVFYGWAVVGASVLATFSSVPMYGPVLSLFMKPVGDDMGWSRGEMSIAFTAGSILGGLSSSVVGRLLDRYGARVSIVVAGMIMTAVLLGLALMQEIWQFWIIFGTGRAAAIVGINLGASVAVANWFIRKRGRTVSFVGIGLRSGQSLFPLFLAPIIVALTWRHAYALLAIVAIAFIVIPAWLFVRRR